MNLDNVIHYAIDLAPGKTFVGNDKVFNLGAALRKAESCYAPTVALVVSRHRPLMRSLGVRRHLHDVAPVAYGQIIIDIAGPVAALFRLAREVQ